MEMDARRNRDYSKGPVWDETKSRWLVEIRYPDGSRFRKRMRRTTGFYAVVDESAGACKGSTPAPGGCVSMTTSGTAGVPITVSIPHR